MKKIIFLAMVSLFLFSDGATALTLEEGVEISPGESNTTYKIDTTILVDTFDVRSNAPYFNSSIFQIEPDSGSATVKIKRWQPPDMEFEITATDNVEITLGGFIANKHYKVSVDGNRYRTFFNANATGVTYFNYNSWSTHLFTIEKYVLSTEGGKGEIPGYISMQYDYTDGDELEETGFFWFVFVGLILLGFVLLFIFVRKRKQKD